MNVSMTPEFEKFVRSKVASGQYHSCSEVVRDALRIMKQRDEVYQEKLAWLRGEVKVGLGDLEAGTFFDGDVAREETKQYLLALKREKCRSLK